MILTTLASLTSAHRHQRTLLPVHTVTSFLTIGNTVLHEQTEVVFKIFGPKQKKLRQEFAISNVPQNLSVPPPN
jgi:hypothetical protein